MRWRSWMLVAGLLLIAGASLVKGTGGRDAHDNAFALSHQVMSPFCPGLTLAACPSGAAADLRTEIATRVKAGEPTAAILDDLALRFGPAVRGVPAARGWGLMLWIVPGVLGLIGALGILAMGRRGEAGPRAPAPLLSPEWAARLDDELSESD